MGKLLKIVRGFGMILLILILVFGLAWLAIQYPSVQSKLVQKVTKELTTILNTQVNIGAVDIDFFKTVALKDIYIEDHEQDTLLFAEELDISIGLFSIFNLKIYLNDVNLENAKIKLKRASTDSLFNYNFIIDAFTSDKPKVAKDSTAKVWEFGIGKVSLHNLDLQLDDQFGGINLVTNIGEFSAAIEGIDIEKERLEIENVHLNKTAVKVTQSSGVNGLLLTNETNKEKAENLSLPYTGWDLSASDLSVEELNLIYRQGHAIEKKGKLNPNDINLENIKVEISDFAWQENLLKALIKKVSLQEKSGLQLNDFSTDFSLSTNEISISELILKTPNSSLQNSTKLSFTKFADLANNFENILFLSEFSKTNIGSQDLEYLVAAMGEIPYLDLTTNRSILFHGKVEGSLNQFKTESLIFQVKDVLKLNLKGSVQHVLDMEKLRFDLELEELSSSYEKANSILKDIELPEALKNFGVFNLKGKMKGALNDLTVNDLILATDANTGFNITGKIMGLPKVSDLQLDLAIKELFTKAEDLSGFSKEALPPLLDSLGNINYQGLYKGTLTKFDLAGKLNTKLGDMESDIFMDFDSDYTSAKYKGDIRLNDFQLAEIFGDSVQVGAVTLKAELTGEGFEVNSLNANLKLNIEEIEYAKYNYKNINLDGLLQEGIFTGNLDLNDPNAIIDFDGTVSLNLEEPVYNFSMLVDTINLQELNLFDDALNLHVKMDMNFSGKQINDFEGRVNLSDLAITNNEKTYATDSLEIEAKNIDINNRKLSINSSFLTGELEGDYDFNEMYSLALAYINEYFSLEHLLATDKKILAFDAIEKSQNFDMSFELLDANPISLFVPTLEFIKNARLNAAFNSDAKTMNIGMVIEELLISGIRVEAMNWTAIGDVRKLNSKASIKQLEASNGINIPLAILSNTVMNDSTFFRLDVQNDSLHQMIDMAAIMTNTLDGFRLKFKKDLVANNRNWTIDEQNFISFGKDFLNINELIFAYNEQSIGIHSLAAKNNEAIPPIGISFENFQIEELSKIANIENTSFEGLLNGQLRIIDPFDNLHYTADLSIPDLSLNEESIGTLSIDLKNPINTQNVLANILLEGGRNKINVSGDYNLSTTKYDVKADLESIELRLIDPIMAGVIGQSEGTINGEFTLQGTPEKPELIGAINLNDVSTIIDFTNTRYSIPEGRVSFDNEEINLGTLNLIDHREDAATLSGTINHSFFSDLMLNLKMTTDRFTFLNTAPQDNELFYGKLYLSAIADIQGPVEQPIIDIKARTMEGSELSVSAFSEEDSFVEESFIIFGNPNTYQATNETTTAVVYEVQSALPAEVKLSLELTDEAIFRVIVDPLTGDQLVCQGNSNLLINLHPSGSIDIFGSYIIESGKYRFSYTDVVKRDFEIVQGSTVEFNGDPLNARFNVTTKYATKATPFELVSNETTLSDSEASEAKKRQDVNVLMKMTGNISDPAFNFDIELPQSEGSVLNSEIQRKLAELQTNPSELNKQVFGLILFNGFIASTGTAGFDDASETVVLGSVSKFVSKELNKIADKYIKGIEIDFDLNSYKSQYANEGNGATVTELGVGVSKNINDRLSFKATGNVDLNSTTQSAGFSQVAGDFVLEYKLTAKGNYLLKVFRRSDFDVLNEENSVKSGAGISVSKSFGGKNKKAKHEH